MSWVIFISGTFFMLIDARPIRVLENYLKDTLYAHLFENV